MFNVFLGAALVVAPFFMKTASVTTTNLSQEFFMAMTSLTGVMFFGVKKTHAYLCLAGAMLVMLAFLATNPFGARQYYQLGMSAAGLVFIAVTFSRRNEIDLQFIQKCLGAVCLIESAWVVLQWLDVDMHTLLMAKTPANISGLRIFGSLGNPNHSGALIACLIPFLRPALWIIPAIALYLCGSAMPTICALVSVIALYSYKKGDYRIILTGAFGLFLSAIALVSGLIPKGSHFSDTHRLQAWNQLLDDVGFQILGKGFGYVGEVFSKNSISGLHFFQMHNEWIELYAIGGLLSALVGMFLILPAFKNKGNPAVNACMISLLVNTLGNFTFHIAPLFMIFGSLYALQLSEEQS